MHEPGPIAIAWVYAESGGTLADVKYLAERGILQLGENEIWRDPLSKYEYIPTVAPILTQDQQSVWNEIQKGIHAVAQGEAIRPYLLHGVTGSGKTECFLFPILDYCYAHAGEPGIKAIILYPMNALVTDQSTRLARMIAGDARLKGRITAGIYIGGEGEQPHGAMGEDHLIDDREVLRKRPPDILLTN